jgi:hypothetical protein
VLQARALPRSRNDLSKALRGLPAARSNTSMFGTRPPGHAFRPIANWIGGLLKNWNLSSAAEGGRLSKNCV